MQIRKYEGQTKQIAGMAVLLERLKNSEEDYERIEVYLSDIDHYIDNFLENQGYTTFIAYDEGKIVGFIIGKHLLNDTYELTMLYVQPTSRKKGFAYKLKQRLADFAKESNYKRIISCIKTDNYASVSLNRKSKWVEEPDKVWPDYYVWYTKEL